MNKDTVKVQIEVDTQTWVERPVQAMDALFGTAEAQAELAHPDVPIWLALLDLRVRGLGVDQCEVVATFEVVKRARGLVIGY